MKWHVENKKNRLKFLTTLKLPNFLLSLLLKARLIIPFTIATIITKTQTTNMMITFMFAGGSDVFVSIFDVESSLLELFIHISRAVVLQSLQ